jgi:diguanylate cyclase (GGDEF)-like protein
MEHKPRAGSTTEIRVRDRTIRVLISLADDLIVGHDEGGLLRSTLEHVVTTLGLSGGVTFVLDEAQILIAVARHPAAETGEGGSLELAEASLEKGRPEFRELPGGGWAAATPLTTRTQSLGVLTLYDRKNTSVAPDLELLEALGKQIGTGLENARLYAELKASSTRGAIMNRITTALTAGMELKTVIPAFARELGNLQSFDRLACGFVNDSGDYIEIVGYPEGATWGLGSVIPVVGSGPGSVVLNSRAILERNLLHSHHFIEDLRLLEEGIRSYVLLPLNSRGRSIGVLALGSAEPTSYDEGTIARLQPLADAVALAFENVRLFQKTRELSITDEVTPLYNVRFFHQILDRELKLVDRYRSLLSLIFVDLDRFKPINDQFGHLRGSRVLREVGFLLRSAVRETDYPARYGGDEFVVILPQTDLPAAQALGEKLRRLIEAHAFLQEEGINARIGVSLGVACYPGEARSKEALIRLADQRMYEDKDQKR